MIRKIIKIDNEKCNGCGICVTACHEGAIGMENGKAKLLRDDYCDGLGDCLPACPTEAISFVEREAAPYNEEAVQINLAKKENLIHCSGGCPGSRVHAIQKNSADKYIEKEFKQEQKISKENPSRLIQWPVQIKLVPINASYFHNANLLIAADCTAFSFGNFHEQFMKNRITLIGCPKLDSGDYSEKLTEIIKNNDIKSIIVARMEVPCCGGIAQAVKSALKASGKIIPWQVITLSTDGRIID